MLAKFLIELGFVRSKTEPCLFTLICTEVKDKRIADIANDLDGKWNGVGYITTLTYIDDQPAAANTVVLLDWLGESLEHRFRKVTCTSFRWFIGFRIIVDSGRDVIGGGQADGRFRVGTSLDRPMTNEERLEWWWRGRRR